LQCFAVCCSVLQCVAVCCSVSQCVTVCCSVLQCVALCDSVLQCGAVCCSVLQCVAVRCIVLQCVAVCWECVAVRYSVLQCVTVCNLTYRGVHKRDASSHIGRYTCFRTRYIHVSLDMVWLCLVGSIKLQVSFDKETYKRDDILQKRPII